MRIKRWDYGAFWDSSGQKLLDELVVCNVDNAHVERLDCDRVFVGLAGENGEQIRIYFDIDKDGILDWWFEFDEPEPTLVPPRVQGEEQDVEKS